MDKGKIILLNGTSSSGKSSIAKLLHQELRPVYLLLQIDDFLNKLPLKHIENQDDFLKMLPSVIKGFHSSIVEFSKSGVNCIVDHVFEKEEWKNDFLKKAKDLYPNMVGLHCPIDILEQREKKRGDRQIGLAKSQLEVVHAGLKYNLEFDTNELKPEECAKRIVDYILNKNST